MFVAFTIEDSYAQHLAVLLASLKRSCLNDVHGFVISDFISASNKSKIKKTVSGSHIQISFLECKALSELNVKVDGHATRANYYRLHLADLLPETIDKVIYLDTDLLVLNDLIHLWKIDLENFAAAAVAYPNLEREAALNIVSYFNSGVMVINLKYWRDNHVQTMFQDVILNQANQITFWDQDVLNIALKNRILPLEKFWNQLPEENDRKTSILHFMGLHKPWSIHYQRSIAKQLYFKFLFRTPYFKSNFLRNVKELLSPL